MSHEKTQSPLACSEDGIPAGLLLAAVRKLENQPVDLIARNALITKQELENFEALRTTLPQEVFTEIVRQFTGAIRVDDPLAFLNAHFHDRIEKLTDHDAGKYQRIVRDIEARKKEAFEFCEKPIPEVFHSIADTVPLWERTEERHRYYSPENLNSIEVSKLPEPENFRKALLHLRMNPQRQRMVKDMAHLATWSGMDEDWIMALETKPNAVVSETMLCRYVGQLFGKEWESHPVACLTNYYNEHLRNKSMRTLSSREQANVSAQREQMVLLPERRFVEDNEILAKLVEQSHFNRKARTPKETQESRYSPKLRNIGFAKQADVDPNLLNIMLYGNRYSPIIQSRVINTLAQCKVENPEGWIQTRRDDLSNYDKYLFATVPPEIISCLGNILKPRIKALKRPEKELLHASGIKKSFFDQLMKETVKKNELSTRIDRLADAKISVATLKLMEIAAGQPLCDPTGWLLEQATKDGFLSPDYIRNDMASIQENNRLKTVGKPYSPTQLSDESWSIQAPRQYSEEIAFYHRNDFRTGDWREAALISRLKATGLGG